MAITGALNRKLLKKQFRPDVKPGPSMARIDGKWMAGVATGPVPTPFRME